MDLKKLWKPLLLLVAIIICSSIFVRVFSGSETLSQYAEKNGTDKTPPQPSPVQAPTADEQNIISSNSGKNQSEAETAPPEPILTVTENRTESEEIKMPQQADRITYQPGFYYEPLSEDMKKRITGISYPAVASPEGENQAAPANVAASESEIQISYDDLRYLSVMYYNLKGIESSGELICNKAIAQDLVEIFHELYQNEYKLEQIRLIDEYNGDDTLSMLDNNTSCFNYRVVDGSANLSKHAYGLAIDINPFYNPYVVPQADGSTYISPPGSEAYADRSQFFAYKIDENDLCYKLFTERGFTWGGNWNSMKDYQHFQKPLP